jgi:glutamate synthase domain-containing protein 2
MFDKRNDFLTSAGLGALGAAGAYVLGRFVFKELVSQATSKIISEPYEKSLFELITTRARSNAIITVDTNLRAETGKALMRPLGTPFPMPDYSGMRFNYAQVDRFPTPNDVGIDTALVLGKKAVKPMKLDIPILIGGMAFGNGLSKESKLAIAEATTKVGTATNSGDGPFNDWERAAAKHYIVQFPRASWNHDPEILRQADMIEIQFGHCGWGGIGSKYAWRDFPPEVGKAFGLKKGEDFIYHANFPELTKPQDLRQLVANLRQITGGVPIGVKISCGKFIERDLAHLLDAEVDVIELDGGQAASHSAPASLMDNFGLPIVAGLCRASRFLDSHKARDHVSLIAGGGLESPGDFLKSIALGADGVSIGTIALIAMEHMQEFKALPYEPPTQLLWYSGRYKKKFDIKKGANSLSNYLRACVEEMRMATMALGKTALRDVSSDDLFAIDELTAKIADIPLLYQPQP